MRLSAPFVLQNFKNILRANPELWGCAIFGPKTAHLSWTNFFGYKPLLLLSSTYRPFSLCNSGSRFMTMHHFWAQNRSFVPNKYFLGNYWYHSHLPISPFHFVKFRKNSSSGSRVMRMRNFWTQNDPFPQIRIFP